MPIRYAPIDRAASRGRRQVDELVRELRNARHNAGLSQAAVAGAIGVSRSLVASWEHRRIVPAHLQACRWGAAVGLDVSIRAFPGDNPLRDAGQLRLLERARARVGSGWTWRTEVPVTADPRDRRAFDAVLDWGERHVAMEAIVRLVDSQGQVRPIVLKQEAAGIRCVVVVLADSRRNRVALRAGRATIAPAFPCSARDALAALRRGEVPAGNAVVLV